MSWGEYGLRFGKDRPHIPREVAVRYGMPHIGCAYAGGGAKDTAFADDWVPCAVCGATATNRHHEPPLSTSSAEDPEGGAKRPGCLLLFSEWGRIILRPALIALCGSGTAGCHGARHSGLLRIGWRFDTAEYEELWLSGWLFAHAFETGCVAHSEALYGYGAWHFEDLRDGREWDYRGGGF